MVCGFSSFTSASSNILWYNSLYNGLSGVLALIESIELGINEVKKELEAMIEQ